MEITISAGMHLAESHTHTPDGKKNEFFISVFFFQSKINTKQKKFCPIFRRPSAAFYVFI